MMLSFANQQKQSLTSRFQRIKRRAQRFDESFLRSVGVTPANKNGNALKLGRRTQGGLLEIKNVTVTVK